MRSSEPWKEEVAIAVPENGHGVESGQLCPFLRGNKENSESWFEAHRRLTIE